MSLLESYSLFSWLRSKVSAKDSLIKVNFYLYNNSLMEFIYVAILALPGSCPLLFRQSEQLTGSLTHKLGLTTQLCIKATIPPFY